MLALVDCNSFYASCERIFRPDLINKPIVVLSNNDGCVIALTNEAKKLGISRGAAYFEVKDLIRVRNVALFSSNYTLYHAISERIMDILKTHTTEIEVYSIDEAWLNMDGLPDRHLFAKEIRQDVLLSVKMPVSIGIASTKTLAKIANKIGKKRASGVYELMHQDHIEHTLKQTNVGDIWGVGRQLNKKLQIYGIFTAYDLSNVSDKWVRKLYNVNLARTVRELRGEPCIGFETTPTPKSIVVSRSFGKKLYNENEICVALSNFCNQAAKKLRDNELVAKDFAISISTSANFNSNNKRFSCRYCFEDGTDSTILFHKMARRMLKQIFRSQYKYCRAGISLDNLTFKKNTQYNLFSEADKPKHDLIMSTMDLINDKFGKGKLGLLSSGINTEIQNRKFLSPNYLSEWDELPKTK